MIDINSIYIDINDHAKTQGSIEGDKIGIDSFAQCS